MSLGEAITIGTIRAALALYTITLAGQLWFGRGNWSGIARGLWTAGCLLLLAHMAAAFHYYHHWSHADALLDTARQTRAQVGFAFGGGIYFNYLFAALWLGEVVAWWLWRAAFERRAWWLRLGVQAYLLFIAINATIVFESGLTRWCGLAVCALLAALVVRRWRKTRVTGKLV